jgi:hypothetical protein
MGTTPPRKYHANVQHCVRGRITFSDTGVTTGIEIGKIPAGSFVLPPVVNIETAFNAATTNVLVVGTSADDDGYLTNAVSASGVAGVKTGVTGALLGNNAADVSVLVKYTQTGTAATAGVADVIVPYYPHSS